MQNIPVKPSDPEVQKELFIYYLNKIYFGKQYLKTHLPQIMDLTHLKQLQLALQELLDDVITQILRMDEIYALLSIKPTEVPDEPIKTIMRNACELTPDDSPIVCDVDIMVHMQLVEHVNIISYRMLKGLAGLLKYKEIEQLLTECFDESREDDRLFLTIAAEYLSA